jgi:site-specific DNA recombinase
VLTVEESRSEDLDRARTTSVIRTHRKTIATREASQSSRTTSAHARVCRVVSRGPDLGLFVVMPTTTPTRVIAYCRVSTDEQSSSGVSLGAQESKLRAYCEALDLVLVAVEVDAGASAKSLTRPALQRALSSLRRGEADALLVTKLDRLTRSVRDLATLLEDHFAVGRSGLISIGESVDTRSAAGRLVLNVMTSVAQWEREAIGERTSTALQHMRSQGRRVGSIPFGYALAADGETLEPVEAEQAIIAEARALRAAGLALRAVAGTLAERGIVSRNGRPFAPEQVSRMLAA